MEMTVSAALRRIKKFKGLISERTKRAAAAAYHEKGKLPAFNFETSFGEREKIVKMMIMLQTAVAVSNAMTKLSDGLPVTYAIRVLEEIKAEGAFLAGLPVRAQAEETDVEEDFEWNPQVTGKVRIERKKTWVSAITQADRAKRLEDLTTRFEKLNNEVEASNNRVVVSVDGVE